ncbi:SusC/RagA family TonB-linked outer membrane protein [Flavisolibacter sp. BT320]|nr:SusC/RagA family TonB-linked outer membrane protein [Flavisolibacter longurius]
MTALFALGVSAQEKRTVTGTIKDADGNPVVAATINEKGTNNRVTSNQQGTFRIAITPGATLVITSVGYTATEMQPDNSGIVAVQLQSSAGEMSGVVVTALGIRREKKSLGYAVQEVKGETLVNAREPNLANALTGKVAGLQVLRSSEGPASSSKIVLRGNKSLSNDNQPLIVVDGIPFSNFSGAPDNGYWNRSLDQGNGLADINPDDIESISVLKGGAAAALYGSRAGNGVIMITTKSGKRQRGLGITFTTSFGTESIFTKPNIQNSFGQGLNGTYDKMSTQSWGPEANGQMVENWNGQQVPLRTYDNADAFLNNATSQNYGLSFQQQFGGTSLYTSFNKLVAKGMVPNNKLDRNNIMVRSISRFGAKEQFTIENKVQYSNTSAFNRPLGGRDNSNTFTLYMLPRSLNILDFKEGRDQFGKMIWYPGAGSQINPYWNSQYRRNQDQRDRFTMHSQLRYNITNWLTAEVKAGSDLYTTNTESRTFVGSPAANNFSLGKNTFNETNFSSMITARKDNLLGKWGGLVSVGGNLMNQKTSNLGSSVGQLAVPDLFSLNNGTSPASVSQYFANRKMNSLYGNFQINYDGFFFVDVTMRNDWTSTLSKDNRSFFYPSVSSSLVYTDMLRDMGASLPSWLSYGKLRASYSQVGNDMSPYQLYNTYYIGRDPNGNITAGRNGTLYDPNIRSELIKSMEFGTEMRFLGNRIGFDVEFYKSNATNQIIDLPLDPQSGYSARRINAGNIQNKGVEIVVDGRVLDNPRGLTWTTSLNYSYNENRILELADGVVNYNLGGFDDVSVRAVAGGFYGEIYGTRYNRVKDEKSPYFDQIILNADGLPTRDPQIVKIGDQQSKGLIGLMNNFSFKGIELGFLIDGRIGGDIFSATHVALQSAGVAAVTAPNGRREDFVVPGVMSNGSGGFTPNTKAVSQQNYWRAVSTANNLGINEAYLYDATSYRLRNVILNYNLPQSIVSKLKLQNVKLGVSCNNVWMIKSNLDGIDPESVYATGSNATGFENGALPTTRAFLFNLSVSF